MIACHLEPRRSAMHRDYVGSCKVPVGFGASHERRKWARDSVRKWVSSLKRVQSPLLIYRSARKFQPVVLSTVAARLGTSQPRGSDQEQASYSNLGSPSNDGKKHHCLPLGRHNSADTMLITRFSSGLHTEYRLSSSPTYALKRPVAMLVQSITTGDASTTVGHWPGSS